MNQLKKVLLGLAVLVALGLVGANSALAQISCTANSVPTLVRSQGITELTGSVVLNCTSSGPSTAVTLTVTIQPSAAVITNSPAAVPTLSVSPGATGGFAGFSGGIVAGTVSGNTVSFTLPACAACVGGNTIQIVIGVNPTLGVPPGTGTVGIRVNVFASGITFPSQIADLLTSSPAGVLAVTNNFLNVAIPQNGLSATVNTPTPGIAQCGTATLKGTPTTVVTTAAVSGVTTATNLGAVLNATDPVNGNIKTPTAVQSVTVTEGFASSFLLVGAPAAGNGEGFDSTNGTRILLTLGTLPSNVVIVAANYVTAGTLQVGLVAGADTNGSGGGSPAFGAGAALLGATVITGNTVTYEVTANSTAAVEAINIPLGIYTIGTPSPAGTSTLSVQMAPISTIGTPLVTPIPRFGAAPVSGSFFVIVPCLTNIFVPWAANTAGYDTGFAIANTTTDIFGTSSQSGTCVYNFFGTNAPSGGTFTTSAFGGGAVDTRLLSGIAPGFFGYIIVQCNFQLGHGFEFIVNGFGGGTPTVGQGGEALIILQPATTGTGGGSRKAAASVFAPGAGEALGH